MGEGLPLAVGDLTVSGEDGRPILSLDALTLAPGATLGVRGPSGAGKTTLIFALAGLLADMRGLIRWGETEIVGLGAAGRRRFRAANVGLVFQDFLLFDELGPAANAAVLALFAPRRQRDGIRRRTGDLLARMAVPRERRTTATLSGGERQRVAIARALAADPAVILADEPTASLHRGAADGVTEALVAHARAGRRTLVAASHDERLLARMDRVLELKGGVRAAGR